MTGRGAWLGVPIALASAALFGVSTPFAKLLLEGDMDPWLLAGRSTSLPASDSPLCSWRNPRSARRRNEVRTHQGRWCYGKTPMQTFLDSLPMAREKLIDQQSHPITVAC